MWGVSIDTTHICVSKTNRQSLNRSAVPLLAVINFEIFTRSIYCIAPRCRSCCVEYRAMNIRATTVFIIEIKSMEHLSEIFPFQSCNRITVTCNGCHDISNYRYCLFAQRWTWCSVVVVVVVVVVGGGGGGGGWGWGWEGGSKLRIAGPLLREHRWFVDIKTPLLSSPSWPMSKGQNRRKFANIFECIFQNKLFEVDLIFANVRLQSAH